MNMQVLLMIQGELNQSITLYNSTVDFLPSEETKSFKFKIKLPVDIEKSPGLHTVDIVALEIPKATLSGNYVGANVAVSSQVFVYVPYPGKFVDSDLNILDAEQNTTSTFIVPLINRGKSNIGSAKAVIDIYTSLNEKVASFETDDQSIDIGARTELSAKWLVNVSSGNYLAKVTVVYDSETKSFQRQFAIGVQALNIDSITVNNFQLGQIAKMQILVENQWNQNLSSVFANLLVYDDTNQVMADVKSAAEDVPALSKKELVAYWDTVGIKEGEYTGKLMVKYGEKSTDKNLVLTLSQNSLDVKGVGYSTRPLGTAKGFSLTTILIALVVILLIINIAWFVLFKKFLSKKNLNVVSN